MRLYSDVMLKSIDRRTLMKTRNRRASKLGIIQSIPIISYIRGACHATTYNEYGGAKSDVALFDDCSHQLRCFRNNTLPVECQFGAFQPYYGQVFRCLHKMAPEYMSTYCQPVSGIFGRRHLRSADRGHLDFPRVKLASFICIRRPFELELTSCLPQRQ